MDFTTQILDRSFSFSSNSVRSQILRSNSSQDSFSSILSFYSSIQELSHSSPKFIRFHCKKETLNIATIYTHVLGGRK